MYRSPRVQIVEDCCMDKYVIEPVRGGRTHFAQYEHIVKMPWYQWREGPDYTTPNDRILNFASSCKGDVGFMLILEESADYDDPTLVSYRLAFTDPDDAVLFKLSAPL